MYKIPVLITKSNTESVAVGNTYELSFINELNGNKCTSIEYIFNKCMQPTNYEDCRAAYSLDLVLDKKIDYTIYSSFDNLTDEQIVKILILGRNSNYSFNETYGLDNNYRFCETGICNKNGTTFGCKEVFNNSKLHDYFRVTHILKCIGWRMFNDKILKAIKNIHDIKTNYRLTDIVSNLDISSKDCNIDGLNDFLLSKKDYLNHNVCIFVNYNISLLVYSRVNIIELDNSLFKRILNKLENYDKNFVLEYLFNSINKIPTLKEENINNLIKFLENKLENNVLYEQTIHFINRSNLLLPLLNYTSPTNGYEFNIDNFEDVDIFIVDKILDKLGTKLSDRDILKLLTSTNIKKSQTHTQTKYVKMLNQQSIELFKSSTIADLLLGKNNFDKNIYSFYNNNNVININDLNKIVDNIHTWYTSTLYTPVYGSNTTIEILVQDTISVLNSLVDNIVSSDVQDIIIKIIALLSRAGLINKYKKDVVTFSKLVNIYGQNIMHVLASKCEIYMITRLKEILSLDIIYTMDNDKNYYFYYYPMEAFYNNGRIKNKNCGIFTNNTELLKNDVSTIPVNYLKNTNKNNRNFGNKIKDIIGENVMSKDIKNIVKILIDAHIFPIVTINNISYNTSYFNKTSNNSLIWYEKNAINKTNIILYKLELEQINKRVDKRFLNNTIMNNLLYYRSLVADNITMNNTYKICTIGLCTILYWKLFR